MEGNYCYKFSTIRNYIERTGGKGIEVIVDVGVNVGEVALMMNAYFPSAGIYGCEAVTEYYEVARSRTQHVANITLFNLALSSQHIFGDDIGERRRDRAEGLRVLKGLPGKGPGWEGGSVVLPDDHELIAAAEPPSGYELLSQPVTPITLKEFMEREEIETIDVMKMDCEGCEHSVLGCAELDTLERIRFITGEYHDLNRFYTVMRNKLFLTHKVNLVGASDLGCFFAERLDGENDGILKFNKAGMLVPRPWLSDTPIEWHVFNQEFVLPEDRYWHALS